MIGVRFLILVLLLVNFVTLNTPAAAGEGLDSLTGIKPDARWVCIEKKKRKMRFGCTVNWSIGGQKEGRKKKVRRLEFFQLSGGNKLNFAAVEYESGAVYVDLLFLGENVTIHMKGDGFNVPRFEQIRR